ncbi:MAG: 3-dehydroquinate synthase [Clostridia bacterium]|nr:3-dehydroquinate synthase [Clostridia bacterium]
MKLYVTTAEGTYDIIFRKGGISDIASLWGAGEKTLVVTDSGVPMQYAEAVAKSCKNAEIFTFPQGEGRKQISTLSDIWRKMVQMELTRSDRVIAVGGGVVGDMAGLAAATYMRGIAFYNVPTTVLSQVDSSVGGKTAVDFEGYKNMIGAFYPPKGVLIDTDTLCTLPARQVSAGLAEALKMAATHDADLFEAFEKGEQDMETLLQRAVDIKRGVVERDEKEYGERKALNFGHTLAHALESKLSFDALYHGECVALGMLPMCAPAVRARLRNVYKKWGLPTEFPMNAEDLLEACRHDKKCSGEHITVIYVAQVGQYEMKDISFTEFCDMIREAVTE